MPHLESKTKLIMIASVNRYINPFVKMDFVVENINKFVYINKKD